MLSAWSCVWYCLLEPDELTPVAIVVLPTHSQCSTLSPSLILDWLILCSVLCRSSGGSFNCCRSTIVVPFRDDSILKPPFPSFGAYGLSFLLWRFFPKPWFLGGQGQWQKCSIWSWAPKHCLVSSARAALTTFHSFDFIVQNSLVSKSTSRLYFPWSAEIKTKHK